MQDQATYILGEGDETKKDQDNYHPIRVKECGIHQGKSDGYQKMNHKIRRWVIVLK
jgi:hypothetical protein